MVWVAPMANHLVNQEWEWECSNNLEELEECHLKLLIIGLFVRNMLRN